MKGESKVAQLSVVAQWSAGRRTPPSMGFSRQEYWSGVPLPSLNNVLHMDKRKKEHDGGNNEKTIKNLQLTSIHIC